LNDRPFLYTSTFLRIVCIEEKENWMKGAQSFMVSRGRQEGGQSGVQRSVGEVGGRLLKEAWRRAEVRGRRDEGRGRGEGGRWAGDCNPTLTLLQLKTLRKKMGCHVPVLIYVNNLLNFDFSLLKYRYALLISFTPPCPPPSSSSSFSSSSLALPSLLPPPSGPAHAF
jgi:hypothetical protein